MGKNKDEREPESAAEPRKIKEVCCEKYLKKGRRCKSCPDAGKPIPQAKDEQK
jgi:hypothetical protein